MATLTVSVIDRNTGRPVVGATILAGGLSGRTDRDGKLAFRLPTATYNVRVLHPSYTEGTHLVPLLIDSAITVPLVPRLRLL